MVRGALPVGPNAPPDPPSDTHDKDGYPARGSNSDIVLAGAAGELATLVRRAEQTLRDAVPPNTRRAYKGDLRRFAAWATAEGLAVMPAAPSTIVVYMRYLADRPRRVATIERALAAIATAHVRAGWSSPWTHPLVEDMRTALRRELGVRAGKKRAADDTVLRQMLAVVPPTLIGVRDRSLLTLHWAMAGRRSEVTPLEVEDVRREAKGLVLLIRSSKTDQEKRGEEVAICFSNRAEHCPVRCLDAWFAAAGITEGAIFRRLGRDNRLGPRITPATVADRIKHWAKVAGLDPREYAGHSMRSGFVTTAVRRGKSEESIMRVTRHRDPRSLRGYIQRENIFEDAAGEGLL